MTGGGASPTVQAEPNAQAWARDVDALLDGLRGKLRDLA